MSQLIIIVYKAGGPICKADAQLLIAEKFSLEMDKRVQARKLPITTAIAEIQEYFIRLTNIAIQIGIEDNTGIGSVIVPIKPRIKGGTN